MHLMQDISACFAETQISPFWHVLMHKQYTLSAAGLCKFCSVSYADICYVV